jgi:hypothetical protein
MSERSPHLDPEWLRRKYVEEGLSTYDIARLVGRDPKRIYEKLRDFGIPTRPRGHNLHGQDNGWAQEGYLNPMAGQAHTPEARSRMSAAASRPRPWLRGEANGMFGVEQASNPNWRGGISPERQRIYASAAWKAVRREVIARDGGVCRRCGMRPSGTKALHLHHIESWDGAPARRLDPENIVTICRGCHEWVHGRANVDAEWLSHQRPNPSSSDRT